MPRSHDRAERLLRHALAGEPDIVQPIAMTFDTRGRLWVVECLSYPKWRADGKGNDRVVILEDTDGDGKSTRRPSSSTTVAISPASKSGSAASGSARRPTCLHPGSRRRRQAGRPAGNRARRLEHQGHEAQRLQLAGLGPDGWLYGCNGIQAKARVGKPGAPTRTAPPSIAASGATTRRRSDSNLLVRHHESLGLDWTITARCSSRTA